MNLSSIPLLKPTVNLEASNPQFAIYGHILSLIGGFFLITSGLFNLLDQSYGAIIAIIGGLFILVIEVDEFYLAPLKESLNRGVIWMLIPAISFGIDLYAIITMFVAGGCYLVYHTRS